MNEDDSLPGALEEAERLNKDAGPAHDNSQNVAARSEETRPGTHEDSSAAEEINDSPGGRELRKLRSGGQQIPI